MPHVLIVILISVGAVFRDQPKVEAALKGMHGAVIALIVFAAFRMAKHAVFDATTTITALVTISVMLFTGVHPLYLIALSLLCGMAVIPIKNGWVFKRIRKEGRVQQPPGIGILHLRETNRGDRKCIGTCS